MLDLFLRGSVYDREPIDESLRTSRVVLLGDAAHPMSPFKGIDLANKFNKTTKQTRFAGQGANQALLDAVVLAQCLATTTTTSLDAALAQYQADMVRRSRSKVICGVCLASFILASFSMLHANLPS